MQTTANLDLTQKTALIQLLANIGQPGVVFRPQYDQIGGGYERSGSAVHVGGDQEEKGTYHDHRGHAALISDHWNPTAANTMIVRSFVDAFDRLRAVRIFAHTNLEIPGQARMGMSLEQVDAIYGRPTQWSMRGVDQTRPVERRYQISPDANVGSANHVRVFFTDPTSDGTPASVVSSIQYERPARN